MKQDESYLSLNTPAVLVDLDKLEANIREMTRLATEAGVKLKPHTKIHECVDIAKIQIEAGAWPNATLLTRLSFLQTSSR